MVNTAVDISAVVLAGGKSRRMGKDKRFLDLHGQRLVDRVLAVLTPIFPEILLVTAGPDPELVEFGYPVIQDLIPGCAALGGVYSGLAASKTSGVFVVACDMPLLNSMVIEHIVSAAASVDVVMPRLARGLQPTHAVYKKPCLPHLERMARTGELKLQKIVENPDVAVRFVSEQELRRFDPELLSFFNTNTPADLEFARQLLSHRPIDEAGGIGASG